MSIRGYFESGAAGVAVGASAGALVGVRPILGDGIVVEGAVLAGRVSVDDALAMERIRAMLGAGRVEDEFGRVLRGS